MLIQYTLFNIAIFTIKTGLSPDLVYSNNFKTHYVSKPSEDVTILNNG